MLSRLPKPFFVLAPMDDVTDTVFRQVVAKTSPPDLFFTEFVNVDALQSKGRNATLPRLHFTSQERPIIAQVWGKRPENYYKSVKDIIAMGYDGIDINMGCPDKTVVKNGCCSALIDNRGLAGEIIEAVQEAAGSHFPISVKTRVGFTTTDLTWIEFLLARKLNMLTIHLRTAKEMSKVPARWELMEQIKTMRDQISPTTLLVGNGDVFTRKQGEELAHQYGLDGIMIGRGIFQDPYIFAMQSNGDTPWASASKADKVALYKSHVQLFANTYNKPGGATRSVKTLNKFCKVYIQGFDGAKDLRERLMGAATTNELLEMLHESA